jgi:putative ATP-dependent endonuclease of OLD family
METFLCMEGYGAVYEANISPQRKATITATAKTPEYWKEVVKAQNDKGKPQAAAAVVDHIEECGPQGIPQFIADLVDMALARAKRAG